MQSVYRKELSSLLTSRKPGCCLALASFVISLVVPLLVNAQIDAVALNPPASTISSLSDKELATPQLIRVAYTQAESVDTPAFYFQQILNLALSKTREGDQDFQLAYTDEIYSLDRIFSIIEQDECDIIWASVTPERERRLLVVPVDLLRDYNNYRLLLIREGNEEQFREVNTLVDLRRLQAGNGTNWTDSRILQYNGIPVVTNVNYGNLVKMLLADRFDYISRGLHEIHNDIEMFRDLDGNLSIAPHVILRYQYPVQYSFFVNKKNISLAKRIEKGLRMAEEDGSFLKIFHSIPAFQSATRELAKDRVQILLDNTIAVK